MWSTKRAFFLLTLVITSTFVWNPCTNDPYLYLTVCTKAIHQQWPDLKLEGHFTFTTRECQTFQPFHVNPIQEHKGRFSTIVSELYSTFASQHLFHRECWLDGRYCKTNSVLISWYLFYSHKISKLKERVWVEWFDVSVEGFEFLIGMQV